MWTLESVPTPKRPPRLIKSCSGEHTVAEICFGHGAQAHDSAALCHAGDFLLIDVSRMHQAPALIDRRVLEQPGNRSTSRPRVALVDFLGLLGDMNMYRRRARHVRDGEQFFLRDRTQAMRSDADLGRWQLRRQTTAAFQQSLIAIERVDEAPLRVARGRATERRVRIEHG